MSEGKLQRWNEETGKSETYLTLDSEDPGVTPITQKILVVIEEMKTAQSRFSSQLRLLNENIKALDRALSQIEDRTESLIGTLGHTDPTDRLPSDGNGG